uniref:Uncharacterized protein n=1 Tax=Anguilla anguilla TaxID=7936 RepID=A0A0E9VNJ6_ANGAN
MRAEQRGSISSVLKNDPVFLIKKRPNFQKLLYHPFKLIPKVTTRPLFDAASMRIP